MSYVAHLFFIVCMLFSSIINAQTVRAVNLSNENRTDIVTTVIPFSPGTWMGEPLSVNGETIQYDYLGASWGESSHARTALVRIPVSLKANETKDYTVEIKKGNYSQFGYSPYIVQGSRTLLFGLM